MIVVTEQCVYNSTENLRVIPQWPMNYFKIPNATIKSSILAFYATLDFHSTTFCRQILHSTFI